MNGVLHLKRHIVISLTNFKGSADLIIHSVRPVSTLKCVLGFAFSFLISMYVALQ